ncbi:hypothetical protein BC829DRAFT_177181 [Chytridium lagenaria]|nr:hypothetical protein BC829DRAFT_177181 [Chytridium lagenaria]
MAAEKRSNASTPVVADPLRWDNVAADEAEAEILNKFQGFRVSSDEAELPLSKIALLHLLSTPRPFSTQHQNCQTTPAQTMKMKSLKSLIRLMMMTMTRDSPRGWRVHPVKCRHRHRRIKTVERSAPHMLGKLCRRFRQRREVEGIGECFRRLRGL